MKIRADFVTNSSSTSFVIISSGSFTREALFDLLGIKRDSPFLPLFESLFYTLEAKMQPARQYWKDYHKKQPSKFIKFVADEFSREVAERVAEAEKEGKQVYMGNLESDGEHEECFFCCDSFEVENGKLYLNALRCVW